MAYQLRTFGGLDLLGPDGSSVEPMRAHSKGMVLLAYLAVEAREAPLARSAVVSVLWPDRSEERAQNALRVTLSRVRRDADPALLEGKGEPTVRLNSSTVDVDVWAFEDALRAGNPEDALAHYEGHFLENVRMPETAALQHWVDEVRERHRDRAYEAALAAGENARSEGNLDAAESMFRRAVELRPLREAAAAGLIRALAERGEVAAALRHFSRFEEQRREELDLAPSEDLEALVEEIRASGGEARPPDRADPEAPAASAGGDEESSMPEASGEPGGVSRLDTVWPSGGPAVAPVVLLLLLLGVTAAALLLELGPFGASAVSDDGPEETPRVAVLPLEVIGSGEQDPVAAGIHGDLVTRLSNVSGLQVISGRSLERFRGRDLPLSAVADSLGASWVIEGEVQRAGDELSVSLQLINPASDSYAWARNYRRSLTAADDLFDLQSDITRQVVEALGPRLGSREEERVERRPTGSLDAYRFYVRGRSLLEQLNAPAVDRALDYFDQALARDSAYALAWAGRADALTLLAFLGGAAPDSILPVAQAAARRALSIDSSLAEAHAAMGRIRLKRREAPAALRSLRRAVELRPSDAETHAWLAELLLVIGRVEEAREHAERAVELNPMSLASQVELAWVELASGNYHDALRPAHRVVELWRGAGDPRDLLASVFFHLRRDDEITTLAAEQAEGGAARTFLAVVRARQGDSTGAERLLKDLGGRVDPTDAVLLNAALGEEDRVFEILDSLLTSRSFVWHNVNEIFLRHFYPETMAAVRSDPRWSAFLRDLHAAWGLNPDGSLPRE